MGSGGPSGWSVRVEDSVGAAAPRGSFDGSSGSGTGKPDCSTSGAAGGFASGSAGLGFASGGLVGMACHPRSCSGDPYGFDVLHIGTPAPAQARPGEATRHHGRSGRPQGRVRSRACRRVKRTPIIHPAPISASARPTKRTIPSAY